MARVAPLLLRRLKLPLAILLLLALVRQGFAFSLAPSHLRSARSRVADPRSASHVRHRVHLRREDPVLVMAAGSGGGGGVQRQTTEGEVIFSKISTVNPGKIEVRQFKGDGESEGSSMRTMWFESSPLVWQSAVRFNKEQPDFSDLPFHSSRALAFATSLSANTAGGSGMIIGLGGGTLAGFLLENTPLTSLAVVEIDPVVVEAAALFGLPAANPRLVLTEGCGLAAALAAPPNSLDVIMLDAGTAAGLNCSCLPQSFWSHAATLFPAPKLTDTYQLRSVRQPN